MCENLGLVDFVVGIVDSVLLQVTGKGSVSENFLRKTEVL